MRNFGRTRRLAAAVAAVVGVLAMAASRQRRFGGSRRPRHGGRVCVDMVVRELGGA